MAPSAILLVDDSEADNTFHRIVLERAGFAGVLQVCHGGSQALQRLAALDTAGPTFVLLDIHMPGMTGWEFLERAQDLLACCDAVALPLLGPRAELDAARQARRFARVPGYLSKPLTLATARELLAGRWNDWPAD